ncbi:MAG: hypothetical protein LAO04_13610 [Acidobacteriia bacterium]|nr:hypothetical protein [Terriglobia bacterium]
MAVTLDSLRAQLAKLIFSDSSDKARHDSIVALVECMLESTKRKGVAPPPRRHGRQVRFQDSGGVHRTPETGDAGATNFGTLAPSELDPLEHDIAATR